MTDSEWKEFENIADQCRQGDYRSINVAGLRRREAVMAVYAFVKAELERRSRESTQLVKRHLEAADPTPSG